MRDRTTTATDSPLLHQVPEACRRLGIGKNSLYKLIAEGRLKPVKIGRRTLLPDAELVRFTDELTRSAK